MGFWLGEKGKYKKLTTLTPEQQSLYDQYLNAAQNRGAGGAFGQAADYYRDILEDKPEVMQAYIDPEMRRYREEIVPELSEQFAGMGSGALSSSGFRNAAVRSGVDLQERLGLIRAQLRQNAAQGLMGMQEGATKPTFENVYRKGQPGFWQTFGQSFARGAGESFGKGLGSMGTLGYGGDSSQSGMTSGMASMGAKSYMGMA